MRILIDGRMILPEMSGVSRYLTGLCRALMDLDSDLSYELWVQDILPAGHPIQQLSGKRLHIRRVPLRHMSVKISNPFFPISARPQTGFAALPALRPALIYAGEGGGKHP